MAEEFQGAVCGGTWWNPPRNLFSSGGFSSPCSVAHELGGGGGGGYSDMGSSFGWPNEVLKGRCNNNSIPNFEKNNSVLCDSSSILFSPDLDSSLDILSFALSPTSSTSDWNQQNPFCNNGSNEGNYESMLQDNTINSRLSYEMGTSSPPMMNSNFSNNNNNSQGGGSPPMALTASSNSSGDSSTITSSEGGGGSGGCGGGGGSGGLMNTSFPMTPSASYLIQTLFDDADESQPEPLQPMAQLISPNYGSMTGPMVHRQAHELQLAQNNNLEGGGGMSLLMNGGRALNSQYLNSTALNNIRVSLLNSLQSRSRAPTLNKQKSHNCAKNLSTKANNEEARDSKSNSNEQPPPKRPRIETPSPLPTFKVRKEKLGDRITALQQLVSPFGKTDTASVLHEAIEYIKFLHDQVNVLSTPYLKNGAAIQQQQQGSCITMDNKESKQDLRSRGLCLVPISSTYPVAHETPVDFWTPTFGGTNNI